MRDDFFSSKSTSKTIDDDDSMEAQDLGAVLLVSSVNKILINFVSLWYFYIYCWWNADKIKEFEKVSSSYWAFQSLANCVLLKYKIVPFFYIFYIPKKNDKLLTTAFDRNFFLLWPSYKCSLYHNSIFCIYLSGYYFKIKTTNINK